jgi:hypothetical protein
LAEHIPSLNEVYAYIVAEINDEFKDDLRDTGWKPFFSTGADNVWHRSANTAREIPFHQYIMPIGDILSDAKARNKVFEDILNGAHNSEEAAS